MSLEEMFIGAKYYLFARAVILLLEVFYLIYKKGLQSDVFSNIGFGIIIYGFFKYIGGGITYGFFVYVGSFASKQLEFSWWLLILTLIAADLSFYTYHVCSHKIRLLWTDHSVHHTSKEFDLTTNLRGSVFNGFYSWLPMAPLLLLGVHPAMVAWAQTFVNDYTFFLHTCKVQKLGWYEKIFNTPSHHRVHHATNAAYIDKNFGAVLIIWDKLFGTFKEEDEECTFGAKRDNPSKNPVTIMLHGWATLARDVVRTKGNVAKMRVLVRM
jgi:sterol desaturase/sphingolipid hydroxylase (fatty acid hydroxylase superfamily)